MTNKIKRVFQFGEKVKDFDIRVLNEREVRASAGILFLFAIISFMNAWLLGNFNIIKIFVITFLIDFSIRIFINPKYSPSLIIGRFIVKAQKPEYVGAPQKRFAWGIGFLLAITMFFLVVINNMIGPINLFICFTCLTFLFFESAFGICLGCMIYNLFNKEKAKLCPGSICEIRKKEEIQKIDYIQILITIIFIIFIIFVSSSGIIENKSNYQTTIDSDNITLTFPSGESFGDCIVPDWAIAIGHEELYKIHHGCK